MEGTFVVDLVLNYVYYSPKIRLVASDCCSPIKMDALSHGRNYEQSIHTKNDCIIIGRTYRNIAGDIMIYGCVFCNKVWCRKEKYETLDVQNLDIENGN